MCSKTKTKAKMRPVKGEPKKRARNGLTLMTPAEIEVMREAGRVVAQCHALMREMAKPGVRTKDLDEAVEALIRERGGRPAFLGYPGLAGCPPFPGSICASVNDEIVHGVPNRRRLQDGDVLSVDVGVELDGFFGDAANTILIGEASETAKRLVKVSWEALHKGIETVRPGGRLSELARAIQGHAESHGYSLVRDYVGHGIGRAMHQDPQVPNFVSPALLRNDLVFEVGLVLAIEPMVNIGGPEVRAKKNSWKVVTKDGSLSAHVEHSVAVTEDGPRILTLP